MTRHDFSLRSGGAVQRGPVFSAPVFPRDAANAGRWLLWCCLLALSVLGGARAEGGVSVSPTNLLLSPNERATQLTLGNGSEQTLTFDLSLLAWSQLGGGDILTPTQAMVAAPAVITLAPGQTQTVRIARLGSVPLAEQAYRLLATQRPAVGDGLSTRLQLSLPLFDAPRPAAGIRVTPSLQASLTPAGTLLLSNPGNLHLRLTDLQVRVADAWQPVPLLYLLAGQSRQLELSGVQEVRYSLDGNSVQLPVAR